MSPVKRYFCCCRSPEQADTRERRTRGESEPERQEHSSEAAGPGRRDPPRRASEQTKGPHNDNSHSILTHTSFLAAGTADPELDLGMPLGKQKLTFAPGFRKALQGCDPPGTAPPRKHPAVTRSLQVPASSLCLQIHSPVVFPNKTQETDKSETQMNNVYIY